MVFAPSIKYSITMKLAGLAIAVGLAGCFAPVVAAEMTPENVLAQLTTVDAGYLKDFLLISIAGISVWSSISTAAASKKSQRREVSMVDNFVTSEDCQRSHDATQKQVENAAADRKIDMNRLYTSIHDLGILVSAHSAKLEIFGQRVTHMDVKLDRLRSARPSKGDTDDE